MGLRTTIFGKVYAQPVVTNFRAGNIASEIPTKADLASKLKISETDISYFAINGNDIEAFIGLDYGYNNVNSAVSWFSPSTITFIDDEKMQNVVSGAFDGLAELKYVKLKANSISSYECFSASPKLQVVILQNVTTELATEVSRYCYGSAKGIYIPNLLQIGHTVNNDLNFQFSPQGVKIWAHPSLQTSNNGSEDLELAWVRANRGAIISYSTLPMNGDELIIPPNKPLNLSITDSKATYLKIGFDMPYSPNMLKYCEVYVNDVLNSSHNINEVYATSLANSTNYQIKIIVVDEFENRSEISSSITGTTTASGTSLVPLNQLLAYYKMNSGNNIVADFVGGNNGKNINLTPVVSSKIGTGLSFNGTNQSVEVGNLIGGLSAFTIGIWFKHLGKPTGNALYGEWDSGQQKIILRINSGAISLIVFPISGGQIGGNFVAFTDTTNYHLVLAKFTGTQLRIKLDNVLSGVAYNMSVPVNNSIVPEHIGKERTNNGNAIIDEVFVYSRSTSDQEDDDFWNGGLGITI